MFELCLVDKHDLPSESSNNYRKIPEKMSLVFCFVFSFRVVCLFVFCDSIGVFFLGLALLEATAASLGDARGGGEELWASTGAVELCGDVWVSF